MHTILVADDSVTIQRAVEIVFDKEPFTVVKTGSGHEALARAREIKPHLVLADHTMGDQTGYDLAAALKADPATSAIPVVLMSAAANPYDEGRGGAAGIVAHVQKPFDCATLLDRVRGILGVEATAPGSFVSTAPPPSTAATAGMPRPPSLGSFTGLPRPPTSSFPPRPAAPAPVAAAPAPRGLDPFGLEAALSQPPAPAPTPQPVPASLSATPTPAPAPSPLQSPSAIATVPNNGWQAMAPGQPIGVSPTPAPDAPIHTSSVPSGLSSTPTPAGAWSPDPSANSKSTAKLDVAAIASAAAIDGAADAVAARAAPIIQQRMGAAPSREAITAEARTIIERIAWEVVPELAELIIKEELARLLKARGA